MKKKLFLCTIAALLVIVSNTYAGGGSQSQTPAVPAATGGKLTGRPVTYTLAKAENAAQPAHPDSPSLQEVFRKTGIQIQYTSIPGTDYSTKMTALLAAGTLPDIFQTFGDKYELVNAKAVLPMKDLVAKYAPVMQKDLDTIPDLKKTFVNGEYYFLPRLRRDENIEVGCIPFLRTDLLKKNNMPIPKTWLEFESIMLALKKIYPDKIMLGARGDNRLIGGDKMSVMGSLGGEYDLYMDNGVWKFGRVEREYKESIVFLARLYSEGILDSEYLTTSSSALWENAGSGKTLFWYDNPTFLLNVNVNLAQIEPEAQFAPIPFMENLQGKRINYQHNNVLFPNETAISSKVKDPVLITKLMNWFYGPEGTLTMAYAVEGDTYELVDGKPQWTKKVIDKYMNMSNGYYTLQSDLGTGDPFFAPSWLCQASDIFRAVPGQFSAMDIYNFYLNDPALKQMPFEPPYTEREAERITEIRQNLDFSRAEINKFIMGARPISEWDGFIGEMKSKGVDDLVKLVNEAEQRYQKSIGK